MGRQTLVSTTETKDDLVRAMQPKGTPDPGAPQAAADPAPVTAEPVTTEPVAPVLAKPVQKSATAKAIEAMQQRIDEVTREKYDTARDRDAARQELDRLRVELKALKDTPTAAAAAPVVATPVVKAKPKEEEFATYGEYQDAVTDWKIEDRLAKQRVEFEGKISQDKETQAREAMERQQRQANGAMLQAHQTRWDAAKQRIENFDADIAASANIAVTQPMRDVIIASEVGPEIVHWLAKNPTEADRINKLAPWAAVREMGKVEARVEALYTSGGKPPAPAPKPGPVAVAARPSNAPAPPRTVGASPTASTRALDDPSVDYKTFKAARERDIRARGGRVR